MEGQTIRNDLTVLGTHSIDEELYLGLSTTAGTDRTIEAIGSGSDIDILLLSKGIGTLKTRSNYAADVADDEDIINLAYHIGHISAKATSSLLQAPTATEDLHSIVWDETNQEYTLLDLGAGITADNGITKTSGNIQWGGPLLQNTNITGAFAVNIGLNGDQITNFQVRASALVDIKGQGNTQLITSSTNSLQLIAGTVSSYLIINDDGAPIIRDNQAGASQRGLRGYHDYSANINSFDYTQKVYTDSHLVGKNISSVLATPTVTQHGYVIAWDDTNTRFNLVAQTGGGSSGHVIQYSGSDLPTQPNLNFTNGLTAIDDAGNTASVVTLGGTLINNTIIDAGQAYEFSVIDAIEIVFSSTGVPTDNATIAINPAFISISAQSGSDNTAINLGAGVNDFRITDNRVVPTGIEYDADYSADYTARSLIDKGYADVSYAPISGSGNYWNVTGSSTITTPTIVGNPFFEGNVLIGNTGNTITASTKLDFRGIGTTTGIGLRYADSSNVSRVTWTDSGVFTFTPSGSTGRMTINFNGTDDSIQHIVGSTTNGFAHILNGTTSANLLRGYANGLTRWEFTATGAGGRSAIFDMSNGIGGWLIRNVSSDVNFTNIIVIGTSSVSNSVNPGSTTHRQLFSTGVAYTHSSAAGDVSFIHQSGNWTSNLAGTYQISSIRLNPILNLGTNTTSNVSVVGIDWNPTLTTVDDATYIGLRVSSGQVVFGTTGVITNNRLAVRGIGTTTGLTVLIEDSAGTDRFGFEDSGKMYHYTVPTTGATGHEILLRDNSTGEITKLGIGTNLSVGSGNLNASGGGGGSSSGANNEVQTSDGSGAFIASKLFFDETTGNMILGDSGLAGTSRNITVEGSGAIDLILQSKGNSNVILATGGAGSASWNGASGILKLGIGLSAGIITGTDIGSPGHILLDGGNVAGVRGNLGFNVRSVPNFQTMEGGIYIATVENIPTGNPTGGAFFYADLTTNLPMWHVPGGTIYDLTATGSGSFSRSINNISSNTTGGAAATTDYVYKCTSTFTFTMPTAVGNTNRYTIKNVGSGVITILFTSGQTGDGDTSWILNPSISNPLKGDYIDFISDGTNWIIVG